MRMLNDKFGWNVLAIQIWKNLPFQLLIIAAVLEAIQTDIEDAARNLGANPWQVVRYILLPMSMPGMLIAVVLVFIMTFGDYAITRIAGPVYPSSLSVLMYTKALTLQQWARRLHRRHHRDLAGLRLALRPARPRLAGDDAVTAAAATLPAPPATRRRLSFSAFLALLVIALLLLWTGVPLFMAVMWSLADPDNPWSPPAVLPPRLSTAQWEYVFEFSPIVQAVKTSFAPAPIVTALSFVLSLPTAYALGRFSFPGKAALRILILLPIIMPGMVIAMFLSRVFFFGIDQTFRSRRRPHAAFHALHAAHPRDRLRGDPAGHDRRRAISAPGGWRWCATSSSPWSCPAFSPAPSSPS